ncbi:SPFH domain-containing protein [Candidatus Riflebacteria bacterium]
MIFFGVAKEWEKHAVFFLGKFTRMIGPGLYFYIPLIEQVLYVIDTRIITYSVPPQEGLTSDNIPVNVDAVVFYQVNEPEAAMLNVDDYHKATKLSAKTAIRDMVGRSKLDELLSERDKIGKRLKEHITEFTNKWGVSVHSVEIKDVIVSKDLEDAIAREAEAEREKRARLKLAEAENLAADTIVAAGRKYKGEPIALQLRAMNMLYEMCMEGKSTMIFVPTEKAIGSMPGFIGVKSIDEIMNQDKEEDKTTKKKPAKGEFTKIRPKAVK